MRFIRHVRVPWVWKIPRLLRIDNCGGSVNLCALFEIIGIRWYQSKCYVLYNIRQSIMNLSIDVYNYKMN